jgi:hypothetical protein
MGSESDVLMKLRPVSFIYKPEHDPSRERQYGLIAEKVADVAQDLVVLGKDSRRRPSATASSTQCSSTSPEAARRSRSWRGFRLWNLRTHEHRRSGRGSRQPPRLREHREDDRRRRSPYLPVVQPVVRATSSTVRAPASIAAFTRG